MNLLCSAVAALGTLTLFPPVARADPRNNPPPIAGWTHEPLADDTTEGHGVILPGGDVSFSSPAIAEIDGDPNNGFEVVVGTDDGVLTVVRADGTILWNATVPNASCAGASGGNKLLSSPAVGALFGDGVPYIVVGYGGVGSRGCDGGVIAYRGADGHVQWTFSLKKFARQAKFGTNSHTVFSSPALADTDRDGKMEIGFGSFDRNVYLLNANGSVRWYYNAADTIWSSPAFANVDNEPNLELIIGTDISANGRLRPPTRNGGYVYAFKTKPRRPTRIGFRTRGAYVWQTAFDQVIYSSPVVADVLPSNPGPEIIIGSGCFFPQNTNDKKGRWIKILRLKDGKVLQTLPTPACLSSSIAVGDIDGDGINEIVAMVPGYSEIGGDGSSRLIAYNADNPSPLWSVIPMERERNDPYGGHFNSPVIADLDGNGSLEVLVGNRSAVGVFAGDTGRPLTCQERRCTDDTRTLYTWSNLRGTPAVGDINRDGQIDVVIGAGHAFSRGKGVLYGWSGFNGLLGSLAGARSTGSIPWGMTRGNAAHTGVHTP